MPMGGRRTHDFPHGRPLPLTLIPLGFAVALIVSAIAFGFKDWRSATPAVAIFIAYAVTYSLVIRRYEQTGQAIRRRTVNLIVRFPHDFPKPLLAARFSLLIVVVMMLVFGIGPFGFDVAKRGIIGCVLGLVGVAAVNVLLERHYVRTGRGIEIEFTGKRRSDL
jgi:hypothetical protein